MRCKIIYNAIMILALSLSIFSFLTNPFRGIPGTDSSIFIYVARAMLHGQVPYLDVFDHKGPLMYVIDALGWCVGGVCGIWILDIVAMGTGLWLVWKCSCFGSSISCESISGETYESRIVAFSCLAVFYHAVACGGNMPEMWIIVFSALAWFLVLDGLHKHVVRPLSAFVMGLCLAQIALLKFNMLAVAVPVFVVIWISPNCMLNGLVAMVGVIVGLMPIVLGLATNGALVAFWEVYVRYNAVYAGRGVWRIQFGFAFWAIVAVFASCLLMLLNKWRNRIAVVSVLYFVVSFALIIVSRGTHRYYGPIIPACVIPLCFVFRQMRVGKKICLCSLASCLFALIALTMWRNKDNAAIKAQYASLRALGEKNKVAGSDSVLVLGCDCHVYRVLDAWCPVRFPYQGTIAQCSHSYRKQMLDLLDCNECHYIVIPEGVLNVPGYLGAAWAKDVVKEKYTLLDADDNYAIFAAKSSLWE